MSDKLYSLAEIEAMANAVKGFGAKNNPTSLTPTVTPLYGPTADGSGYGPLSLPGVRPEMFSTIQRPASMARRMGIRMSLNANEKIGILTSASDATGTNPADFCGDAARPGVLRRCVQNYVFGKWAMRTNLENVAEAGEFADYADMMVSPEVLNQAPSLSPFMPSTMAQIDLKDRNGQRLATELYNIGIALERGLEKVLVRGNRTLANTATERGFIREFDGLERQVITGRVDMDSGDACAAADSTVIAWNATLDATVGGRNFVQMITDLVYSKQLLAEQVGMAGTVFEFRMSTKIFRAIAEMWPCSYLTHRCATIGTAGAPISMSAAELRAMTLDMFNNRYLLVDGVRYPVILTDGIRSTRASGSIWTDDNLFFVPVMFEGRWLQNIDFKKMDNADAMSFANFAGSNNIRSINNGMFLVSSSFQKFCVEHHFAAKLRFIQEAPFLAAVVNTIQYAYQAEFRDPYPGTTAHFGGGVTRWDGNYTVS